MARSWKEDLCLTIFYMDPDGYHSLGKIQQTIRHLGLRRDPLPDTLRETISGALERASSDSENYENRDDLFRSAEIRSGLWGLSTEGKRRAKDVARRDGLESLIRKSNPSTQVVLHEISEARNRMPAGYTRRLRELLKASAVRAKANPRYRACDVRGGAKDLETLLNERFAPASSEKIRERARKLAELEHALLQDWVASTSRLD